MKSRLTQITILKIALVILAAGFTPADAQIPEPIIVDSGVFPAGQPILMADEDSNRLFSVTGRLDGGYWGFALYVSDDAGGSWNKTYDEVWSEGYTHADAVLEEDSVYVSQIDSWSSGNTEYFDLTVQRFDSNGNRDASFGGSGTVSVSGTTTFEISDVSLVAGAGYLEVFWIQDHLLRHSYLAIPSASSGVYHSNIGAVTAYGSLDAVAMSGSSTDFFAAFLGEGLQLRGWRWTFGVGHGLVDITPEMDLYPENEDVTVSSFGDYVEVVVATPYYEPETRVYSMWSSNDAVSWHQEDVAWATIVFDRHVWDPSVVTGPEGSILTYQVKDDLTGSDKFYKKVREHGGEWSGSEVLTSNTGFIGTPMGLCWSAGSGFTAAFYSNNPAASTVNFVRLQGLFSDGFEGGDLSAWSAAVGD